MMTNPYLFPLTEAVFTYPKNSMCKSSKGLEVETTYLALKEVFENLPLCMPHKENQNQTLDLEGL